MPDDAVPSDRSSQNRRGAQRLFVHVSLIATALVTLVLEPILNLTSSSESFSYFSWCVICSSVDEFQSDWLYVI